MHSFTRYFICKRTATFLKTFQCGCFPGQYNVYLINKRSMSTYSPCTNVLRPLHPDPTFIPHISFSKLLPWVKSWTLLWVKINIKISIEKMQRYLLFVNFITWKVLSASSSIHSDHFYFVGHFGWTKKFSAAPNNVVYFLC